MKPKSNPLALILVTFLGLALLVYTGSRTVRLVEMTLPDDAKLQGYMALAALDGGLIFWSLAHIYTSKSQLWQRAISLIMIIVSLSGVIMAMIADTWLQASHKGTVGKVSEDLATGAIWLVTVVIALNVLAVICMHLAHSEESKTVSNLPPVQPHYKWPQPQYQQQVQVMPPPPPPPNYSLPAEPAQALPRPAEFNPSLIEVKESESQPGHFAKEATSPFTGTVPTV